MMTTTHTETQIKLSEMLREPTGRHMLDSGGAYGRNWERNQAKTIETFKAEPRAWFENYGGITLSLFHFLDERLTYDAELDAEWQAWQSQPERADIGWLELMETFAEMRQAEHGKAYPFERPTTENSYNQADLLTQTIQFTMWSEGETLRHYAGRTFILLQIHGGCDVRGGYSTPVLFEVEGGGDYAFEMFDYHKAEVHVEGRTAPIPEGTMRLDGTPTPDEERDPQAFTRYEVSSMHGTEAFTYGGDNSTIEDIWGEHAELFMDDSMWDEDRKAYRCPDGNGWLVADAPFVSG